MLILTIGYEMVLLKDETGLQQLLKILGNAIDLDYAPRDTIPGRTTLELKQPIRVMVETVGPNHSFVTRSSDGEYEPCQPSVVTGTAIVRTRRRAATPAKSPPRPALPRPEPDLFPNFR